MHVHVTMGEGGVKRAAEHVFSGASVERVPPGTLSNWPGDSCTCALPEGYVPSVTQSSRQCAICAAVRARFSCSHMPVLNSAFECGPHGCLCTSFPCRTSCSPFNVPVRRCPHGSLSRCQPPGAVCMLCCRPYCVSPWKGSRPGPFHETCTYDGMVRWRCLPAACMVVMVVWNNSVLLFHTCPL